jgi:outer membrane receptor protein involved in Fe transport
MSGTWIMDKMTVDDEVMFEKDSIFNPQKPPNIYSFSDDSLFVSGPQYFANYKIEYLDSSQVVLDGIWTYGIEGESTYRTDRVYDIDHFQITSYYTFLWTDFLEDIEKEEEVLFRRITPSPASSLVNTSIE